MCGLKRYLFSPVFAVAASALVVRQEVTTFQLYAYGVGIGGLPVFHSGGVALIGNGASINSSDVATVAFTPDGTTWTGNPSTDSTWSNLTLSIPGPGSSSHQVSLISGNDSTTDLVTTGFNFYGPTALIEGSSGEWQTLWYALPSSEASDVWTLNWNMTGDDTSGKVPVSLRDIKPSNSDLDAVAVKRV